MPALKCPNPSCPYLFDPSGVPPGVLLACPRCGMRFTLGPAAPPAAAPPAGYGYPPQQQPAHGRPPGYPPGNLESTATYPPQNPAGTAPPGGYAQQQQPPQHQFPSQSAPPPPAADKPAAANKPAAAKTPHPSASTGKWQVFAIAAAVIGLMASSLGYGLYVAFKGKSGGGRPAYTSDGLNFGIELPPGKWTPDDDLRTQMGVNIAVLKRDDSDAWVAYAAEDYKTRDPRPGELRDGMKVRLAKLFDTLTTGDVPKATWLGAPATGMTFRGVDRASGATIAGECYAAGVKGVAYWFFGWSAEAEAAARAADFEAARGRFKVLDFRDAWVARQPQAVTFRGEEAEYQLIDTEGLWSPVTDRPPRDEDRFADMLLEGVYTGRKKLDLPPKAWATIYVLDDADGGFAAARKHIQARFDKDKALFGETTIEDVTDDPAGDPAAEPKTGTPAEVERVRTRNKRSRDKAYLIVLSTLKVGDKLVVVDARCEWADREVWERRLMGFAATLRDGR